MKTTTTTTQQQQQQQNTVTLQSLQFTAEISMKQQTNLPRLAIHVTHTNFAASWLPYLSNMDNYSQMKV